MRRAISEKLRDSTIQAAMVVSLVIGALGGSGGVVALRLTYPEAIRPDKFTGSDWVEKSAELQRNWQMSATTLTEAVTHIDKQLGILETRFASSEAIFLRHEELLERELVSLERLFTDIDKQLIKISDSLADFPHVGLQDRVERLERSVYDIPK